MNQFLILATDYTDSEALSRRLAVRETHLARMRTEKAAGIFVIGGARLDEQGNMYASVLVVQLPTKADVEQWVSIDPYVTGKVWEHVEIFPFKVADV